MEGLDGIAGAGGETVVPCPLILIPQGDKSSAQHTANSVCHSRLAMVKLDIMPEKSPARI